MRIRRAELGNLGRYRNVGDGVLELIVDTGPGYRVYVALTNRDAVLLLAGGSKRSQSRDIAAARNRWSDYKLRSISTEFGA
jgi:putative addiction module killer protein